MLRRPTLSVALLMPLVGCFPPGVDNLDFSGTAATTQAVSASETSLPMTATVNSTDTSMTPTESTVSTPATESSPATTTEATASGPHDTGSTEAVMTTDHETGETGDTSGCLSGGCAEASSTGTDAGTTTSDETTGPGCMVDCVPRVVFVTMMFYANNLGGTMFADSECNADAGIGGLSGTYRAWLSTDEESPKDWLDPVFDGDYVLAGEDPPVVATGTAGLLSGTLKNPINADSQGTVQTSLNKEVWTGTLTTGLASGIDCTDWGVTTGSATVGHHNAVNKDWTELSDTGNCAGDRRFYCVQVSQ